MSRWQWQSKEVSEMIELLIISWFYEIVNIYEMFIFFEFKNKYDSSGVYPTLIASLAISQHL